MSVIGVVGASYGDEGKGKITDMLCSDADVCVRFQGGANAGHSVVNDRGSFALHILPSGVFNPNTINIIGNGVALNVNSFIKEINELKEKGVDDFKIYVSNRAQVVMKYHVLFDSLEEERRGKNGFGSTKSGIAPFYSDKSSKIGFTVFELYETEEYLRNKIATILPVKNTLIRYLYNRVDLVLTEDEVYEELMEYKKALDGYVADTSDIIREADKSGKKIVLEGQLGSLRDLDFGIYPFTTSSSPLVSYAPIGCGVNPNSINRVVAVAKAYSTSVGTGYMVPKMEPEEEEILRNRGGNGGEFGVTTGRARDVSWFDAVSVAYGCKVQNATEVALTCVDCLGYMDEIKICSKYKVDGKYTSEFPIPSKVKDARPCYEVMKGWKCDIRGIKKYEDLPVECRAYIERIEELIGVYISMIGVGPGRSDIIIR